MLKNMKYTFNLCILSVYIDAYFYLINFYISAR